MLADSPDFVDHTNVVVVAGINDITRDSETTEELLNTVEKGVDQIHKQLISRDTHLPMVAPSLPQDAPAQRLVNAHAYDKILAGLSHSDNFPFTYLKTKSLNILIVGYHPTVEGTKALLRAIHGKVPIIANVKFTGA